ncbi:hypothetical protein KI387_017600, partial [Taxus chinensis]
VKNSGTNQEEQKRVVKVGQKKVTTDEKLAKRSQDAMGKITAKTGNAKEESLSYKVIEESHGDPGEPMENLDEPDGEGDEEVNPEDLDQEGEEMEEYEAEEEYEEVEGEEGDYEDAEAGADEAEEDEEQHEIEMPVVVQERRRKKELEVFVGGLDKDAVEEDLRKVFTQVGEVVEVRLLRNPITNKNKGFAFVGFATTEEAKHAVDELRNIVNFNKKSYTYLFASSNTFVIIVIKFEYKNKPRSIFEEIMCGGPEHPEPNGVCDAGTTSVAEKENDHTGMNKLKDVGNVHSSLLESAANNDLIALKQTLKEDVLKITEVSLWYGRKHVSNQMVLEQRTPARIAALFGSLDVLNYILSIYSTYGLDMNHKFGSDNSTALHCAAAGGSCHAIETVKLLIQSCADVKKKLTDYGVDGLEEITLVGDTHNDGLSRGFAFLEFGTHMDAMNAYKRLQNPDVIFGGDRIAKVAFAEPLHEPDAEVMAQINTYHSRTAAPVRVGEDFVKRSASGTTPVASYICYYIAMIDKQLLTK